MDLASLADDFKQRAGYASVDFKGPTGDWRTDSDPCFGSISKRFQERGYIDKEELREIGRWKVQGRRIDRHLKDNSVETVEAQSALAFDADTDQERIAALAELKGVRVPVASTILAMWKPKSHAVIDFRALRALPAARPELLDQETYAEFAEFLELFRTYGTNPDAYEYYIDHVRDIADESNLLTREVDMALWEYDRCRTES
jgi:hypothetical protein